MGTFGRVKLVLHKPSDTAYALKCMRKQQVVATKQQSHVLNEKRILAAMDHPFILRLVSTYQDEGELYMLMELGLGGTFCIKPIQRPSGCPRCTGAALPVHELSSLDRRRAVLPARKEGAVER